jgi:hypothetical protein
MSKFILNILGWALIIIVGLHYCGKQEPEKTKTYTQPPRVIVTPERTIPDDGAPPSAKYSLKNLLNIWDGFFNFQKPDITSLPDCPDTLEPLERVNCRADLVNQLAALEKQTFDRGLYLTGDKAAFKLNQEKWITDTLNKCKDDACLETAYRLHIRAFYASTFRLVDIIQTGVFTARPFIGSYNFNWPIIVALAALSAFLFICILYARSMIWKLQDDLQNALKNSGPASGTANQNGNHSSQQAPPDSSTSAPSEPWYVFFGVSPNASHDEVKKVRNAKLQIWHPDKCANLDEATKKEADKETRKINAAYEQAKTANGWA